MESVLDIFNPKVTKSGNTITVTYCHDLYSGHCIYEEHVLQGKTKKFRQRVQIMTHCQMDDVIEYLYKIKEIGGPSDFQRINLLIRNHSFDQLQQITQVWWIQSSLYKNRLVAVPYYLRFPLKKFLNFGSTRYPMNITDTKIPIKTIVGIMAPKVEISGNIVLSFNWLQYKYTNNIWTTKQIKVNSLEILDFLKKDYIYY
jgi:hypothetical protein